VVSSFEDTVQRALDGLPKDIAAKLENVAVVIADEDPADPDLFGLWQSDPWMPDKVTIYRRPLEAEFGHDSTLLEREIRITVLHELAHYFGIDEDRLSELGYG
jgi:predicted Zn-dependent protease with MMP-like domain